MCMSPMTSAGISTVGEVFTLLDAADNVTLGAAIQKSLTMRAPTKATPTEGDYQRLLAATGAASLQDFFRLAVMVMVDRDGVGGLFVRLVEKPDRGNVVHLSISCDPLAAASQFALGDAVRRMFAATSPR